MDARDARFLTDLLQERTEEYRAALHATADELPGDYGISRMDGEGVGATFPLYLDAAQMKVEGGGRLASLVRHDGEPLIALDHPMGALYLDFVFRREGGHLVATR